MTVDLSGSIYKLYKDARLHGESAKERGAFANAAGYYLRAAKWMRVYADYTHDSGVRKERIDRVEKLLEAARELSQRETLPAAKKPQTVTKPVSTQDETVTAEDDYEEEVLALIYKSDVRWEEIGGLEETKNAIKSAYALALARKPEGVTVASWRNILLYGPPGTGKTLLAAATAGNLEATFFNVKVSNLLSKYFGESTKLISALYSVARRLSPAVIFLDEFESLTPTRGSGESGAERRIISTLLAELDGLKAKDDDSFVLTMCATNMPWLLDLAVLSRFQRRIYVPLPDDDARQAILEIHINHRGHQSQVPMSELVQRTQGFAGREIEQLCQIAINAMVRRANPKLLTVVDQVLKNLQEYELTVASLEEGDFQQGFDQVQPVADEGLLRRYEQWHSKVEN